LIRQWTGIPRVLPLRAYGAWIVFLFAACHPSHHQVPAMADNRIFSVTAEITGIRQQDISKTSSKKLIYTYFDLRVVSSKNKVDPSIAFPVTDLKVSRLAVPEDNTLKVGMEIKADIGVDKLEKPTQFYWIK
jgi:hypothetical protein